MTPEPKQTPMRRIAAIAALALAALSGAPARAQIGGYVYGTVVTTSGCKGSGAFSALSSGNNDWLIHATIGCVIPQSVTLAAQWNPGLGGAVDGVGTGSFNIAKLRCGSNTNIAFSISMSGGTPSSGTATLTYGNC